MTRLIRTAIAISLMLSTFFGCASGAYDANVDEPVMDCNNPAVSDSPEGCDE
jgi:hypothetical protein